jgi:transposase
MGHEVRIMAPQFVKPYVKRGKNDAADAEALCEAMSRPSMRFVAPKTTEQQAALMLVSLRDRLVRSRTQLTNAIRGHAAEFGVIASRGLDKIDLLLALIATDESIPALARSLFAQLGVEFAATEARSNEATLFASQYSLILGGGSASLVPVACRPGMHLFAAMQGKIRKKQLA